MTEWIDDRQLPIRGPRIPAVKHMPPALSSAMFPLDDIRQIKNFVGGLCKVHHMLVALIFILTDLNNVYF